MIFIIHHNDWDGWASAWVAKKALCNLEPIQFFPIQYGQPFPIEIVSTSDQIYILDFSFTFETLMKVKEKVGKILVIDHHKTAQKDLSEFPDKFYDNTKSGAWLTWEYFFPDKPIPLFIEYVQDHDLFKFESPNSKEIRAYFRSFDFSLENCEMFNGLLNYDHPDEKIRIDGSYGYVVTEGEAILRHEEQQVKKAVESAKEIMVCGHKILACNSSASDINSMIGHELAKNRPFGMVWFYAGVNLDGQDQWICELRSTENGEDVSKIATRYKGGGHQHASAFTITAAPPFIFRA